MNRDDLPPRADLHEPVRTPIFADWRAALLAVQLVLMSIGVATQTREASITVRPLDVIVTDGAGDFALFGPRRSIDVEFTVVNEAANTEKPLVLNAGFFQAIRIELRAQGAGVEMVPQWRPEALCPPRVSRDACNLDEQLSIEPNQAVRAVLMLTSKAQPFTPGSYELHVDSRGARAHLLEAGLTQWEGRVADRGVLPFLVQSIRDGRSFATYHRLEAGKAMQRNDYTAALDHYRLVAQFNPRQGRVGMGVALTNLGRYGEAITVLEQVMAGSISPDSLVPQHLALAYVAAGREDSAERLLRQRHPQDAASATLTQLRERAKRLPSVR